MSDAKPINQLRENGYTLQEIADYFGRSVYWVYCKIHNKKYSEGDEK